MLSVYQHWDPLKACIVGRSYGPEFYDFIENPRVRSVLERIAIETEEDYQELINLLESFGVTVIRTDISENRDDHMFEDRYYQPPMCPRDHTIMLGKTFFMPGETYGLEYHPISNDPVEFNEEIIILRSKNLSPQRRKETIRSIRDKLSKYPGHVQRDHMKCLRWRMRSLYDNPLATFPNNKAFDQFGSIREYVKSNGNKIITDCYADGANITRVGKDVYHGTVAYGESEEQLKSHIKKVHSHLDDDYRVWRIDSNTHSDACYCPVKPGLLVTLESKSTFAKSFPGWEVVTLPNQSWAKVEPFLKLKDKNKGKWWVPGEELNDEFTEFVETWLRDWVLYVEETVFDVNMLVIDENNVVCNNYNKEVFDAFERHGVTPHIVNFRHRYFWDGGLHCITSDLYREGTMQDYFPERSKK